MSSCNCFCSKLCKDNEQHLGNATFKEANNQIFPVPSTINNIQLNTLNRTSTQSKHTSNQLAKEEIEKPPEESSSKRYSFISSNAKSMHTDTNKAQSSFTSSLSSQSKCSHRHSHSRSLLSCDCEGVLALKGKRHKLNENELLLNNVILDEEIASAPKLIISDLEGRLLEGEKLTIDAAGLLNGLRKKRDGFAFFGLNRLFNEDNTNEEPINDFLLNIPKAQSKLEHLFLIYYHRQTATYFLKSFIKDIDCSCLILTLKVTHPYAIHKKTIVIIGNVMMVLSAGCASFDKHSGKSEDIQINVVLPEDKDGDEKEGRTKEFKFNSNSCKQVTIGREGCSINLKHNYYSKPHCSVAYNVEKGIWELWDGDSSGNKKSVHGTWVLINSELCLGEYDHYVIKLNRQMIQIAKELE